MKLRYIALTTLGLLFSLCGCQNNGVVKDPPTFVEMYLDDEEVVVPSDAHMPGPRFLTGPKYEDPVYDESIYSETDFEIAVVTNGIHYDLLYSVEVEDSLLGTCVYTDQSVVFHATSTIIVEADQTYTTTVSLTVPGSYDHTTYLSDRTISLTKILFARDTVDGTFPADIPTNLDTVLTFEVHAVDYFDSTLGYNVVLNEQAVDVILKPDTPEYTAAAAQAETQFTIPATINGYPIGRIFLQDLTWVTHLTIDGGRDDVFIIGSFPALMSIDIAGLNHELAPLTPTFKHLTITGAFSALTSISVDNCHGYRMFLCHDWVTQNSDYDAYITAAAQTPYALPELESIYISGSSFDILQIGADAYALPFPKLKTVMLTEENRIGMWKMGLENNHMDKLETVLVGNCYIGTSNIEGTKAITETGAALSFTNGEYGYITIKGSLFRTMAFPGAELGELTIDGGTVEQSPLVFFELTTSTFTDDGGTITLKGDHPLLETIVISDCSTTLIRLGGIEDSYPSLATISISNVTAFGIYIGERQTQFGALTSLVLTNLNLTGDIRIGYEGGSYPLLEEIIASNIEAEDFEIGWSADEFDVLDLVYLENVILTGYFDLSGAICPLLSTVVFKTFTAGALIVNPTNAVSYVAYCDAVTVANGDPYFSAECATVYVTETDPTTWPYYTAVHEDGFPIVTGVYMLS